MNNSYINTKYKYIFPSYSALAKDVDIEDLLYALDCPVDNHNNLCCPNNHKGKHKLKIFKKENSCHCHNCGEFGGDPVLVVKKYKDLSMFDAIAWICENLKIDKIENPNYSPQLKERKTTTETKKVPSKIQYEKAQVKTYTDKIVYDTFNPNKKYMEIEDLSGFLPSGKRWVNLSEVQRLKVVYTYLYRLSLKTEQKAKMMYYKKRAIDLENNWLKKLGYISVKEFDELLDSLLQVFSSEILESCGVIKIDDNGVVGLSWKYVKKGGIILVPSFDLYTDMVTGFMLRPTHPEKWMKDRGMKEIQLSKTSILAPLPFGLTYHVLKTCSTIKATEGHPDALAFEGNTKKENTAGFMSVPGVHGFHKEHLGLLRGKNIEICFDQDLAGQKAAHGYYLLDSIDGKEEYVKGVEDSKRENAKRMNTYRKIEFKEYFHSGFISELNKAGAASLVRTWDKSLGSDVNDARINGNIKNIFK